MTVDTNSNQGNIWLKWCGFILLLLVIVCVYFKVTLSEHILQACRSISTVTKERKAIKPVTYALATEEEKKIFEVLSSKSSLYPIQSTTLLYHNNSVAVVVAPSYGAGNFPENHLLVGFFRLNTISSVSTVVSFENYPVSCVQALSLNSSCSFISSDYAAFFVAEGSVAGGDDSLLVFVPTNDWAI